MRSRSFIEALMLQKTLALLVPTCEFCKCIFVVQEVKIQEEEETSREQEAKDLLKAQHAKLAKAKVSILNIVFNERAY